MSSVSSYFAQLSADSSHWINPREDKVFDGYKTIVFDGHKEEAVLINPDSNAKILADGFVKVDECAKRVTVSWKGAIKLRESPSSDGWVVANLSNGDHVNVVATVKNQDGVWVVCRMDEKSRSVCKIFWAFACQNDNVGQYLQDVSGS